MAGSPWVPPREPHGPAAFRNQQSEVSPRRRGGAGRWGTAPGGCYLFMCRVSPHTCARIAAARRSLALAGRSAEEPSGLGTWAMSTRSLRTPVGRSQDAALSAEAAGGRGPGRTRLRPRLWGSATLWVPSNQPASWSWGGGASLSLLLERKTRAWRCGNVSFYTETNKVKLWR